MEFLSEYGVFLAKAITIVAAVLVIISGIASVAIKAKDEDRTELKVSKLNDEIEDHKATLEAHVLSKDAYKLQQKEKKAQEKADKKARGKSPEKVKPRVFVLDFDGDIKASATEHLRDAITAVLQIADPEVDEIVLRLESGGGMVHAYGLASAQLDRIKKAGLRLTVSVDKVAASGGYMMACVGDKIIASPFAILGSIGVVAQMPNFHKLLKKNDIDFEVLTAGEYKRTLTLFGENTDKGREKFQNDLEETHGLFKGYVSQRRPQVQIEEIANGDIWFGSQALEEKLVDEVLTSDEYLMQCCQTADVFSVDVKSKKTLVDKLGLSVSAGIERALSKILSNTEAIKGLRS